MRHHPVVELMHWFDIAEIEVAPITSIVPSLRKTKRQEGEIANLRNDLLMQLAEDALMQLWNCASIFDIDKNVNATQLSSLNGISCRLSRFRSR